MSIVEVPESEQLVEADLVLLAMGFLHPKHEGLIKLLGIDLDNNGNIRANTIDYKTCIQNDLNLLKDLNESLNRLNTDYLDYFLLKQI